MSHKEIIEQMKRDQEELHRKSMEDINSLDKKFGDKGERDQK